MRLNEPRALRERADKSALEPLISLPVEKCERIDWASLGSLDHSHIDVVEVPPIIWKAVMRGTGGVRPPTPKARDTCRVLLTPAFPKIGRIPRKPA